MGNALVLGAPAGVRTEGPYMEPASSPTPPTQRNSSVTKIQEEIDQYLEQMQEIQSWEPDEVYRRLSAWTARASEIQIQASRTDSALTRQLINKEIQPFIRECERQFQYHSRLHAFRDTDIKLAGRFA